MSTNNHACALLAVLVLSGAALADNTPGCGQVQISERVHRPTHFSIRRDEDSFEYHCTLRKNKYRKKDPAVFRQECEVFVNEYIDILNRCENAGIPRFMLDVSREQREKQESGKFLKYRGVIPIS